MDDTGNLEVRWIQGFTNTNIEFIDNTTVCYVCGNFICFLNLETKIKTLFQCPGRGIGAFTANSHNGIFALSEHNVNPSIFIYIFPELELKNELKGTTQLDYTSLALSNAGPYLTCCSTVPDNIITVWNWEDAEILCTHAQTEKDVISLTFNPMNWLQMCSLGATSITVWDIQKSASFHMLKPSVIELPATDGSFVQRSDTPSYAVSDRFTYFGPEMPPSAISGVTGDKSESIVTKLCSKSRLTPAAFCWTATSLLYVGCVEGFLLLVDLENLSVSVVFNPATPDAITELKQNNFLSLVLNRNGLIAVGQGKLMHCLKVKGNQIEITQTWELETPVTAVKCSPDHETLLLSSNMGQLHVLNPAWSEKMLKVIDVLSGNFVVAVFSHSSKSICVTVRDSGILQLWSAEGFHLSSLSLQAKVTSLACCPIAQYSAVGTASGDVLFIDLNNEQHPRLVHQVHLYHTSVDHLVFDQEGHFLLTGSSDSHVYVINAKPSKRFSVIGYTVVPGPPLSISTQYIRDSEQVIVLALCSSQKGRTHDGGLLTSLTLSARGLAGPDCVDKHGYLSNHILKVSRYEVAHPLTSCVLGIGECFGYCHRRKIIQRFQLPQDPDDHPSEQVVMLKPDQEVRGHPLGPASLMLSPHHLWLASIGQDGLLRITDTASMEQYLEIQCHSYRLGGIQSVSFSADSQTLLTTGFNDGSLLCTRLRIRSSDVGDTSKATLYRQSMFKDLEGVFTKENSVLTELPELTERSPPPPGAENQQQNKACDRTEMMDMIEQDESYISLVSATPSQPTWIESRQEEVVKADNQQYSEIKKNLRRGIEELRDTIKTMMQENEKLPDNERLELFEFNLDVEEQRRLDAMVEQEVTRVRKEIEWENLTKCYLRDVIKREFWDSMKVNSKSVKAFHSEHEVRNYPMKERSEEELEELHRVENMRRIEMAACANWLKKRAKPSTAKEEDEGGEGQEDESLRLMGTSCAQLGNSLIYDQFSVQTTEQKINQIVLLQDVIYQVKVAFNAEFDALHRQKVLELGRLKDRNRRIRDIMVELDISEELWEPDLTDSEQPERLLSVHNSEITVEKYLTPEQREEEERKRLKEQRRLAAKEIPLLEFALAKPSVHWTEEEKKAHKEYQKKKKALSEEQEEYRKLVVNEMDKLKVSNKDATEKFDESLMKLFDKKMKCEMTIHQEQLKVASLLYSILMEEEVKNRELELKLKLDKMLTHKDELEKEIKKHEDDVRLFHESYDVFVADDKFLDRDFKKVFSDMPDHIVNQLYKLYKRRPRVQKMKTQATDNNPNIFKYQHLSDSLAADGLPKMLKAMEELDAPENKPEGIQPVIWERLCIIRREKVEREHQIKVNALNLAEMQAFLQQRRAEEAAAEHQIKNIINELDNLHKEKTCFLKNIMVQVLIKQGQVEVTPSGLAPDYSDSVLVHRSVVEDLNKTVRTLGEQKIASMVKRKNFRKGIIQWEWEHRKLRMQIEDLRTKARDIQKLRISEDQQEYLRKTDRKSRVTQQLVTLEKTIEFQQKIHQKNVEQRQRKIAVLKQKTAKKAEQNAVFDQQKLPNMQLAVAERRHICEMFAAESDHETKTDARFKEIVQNRKLKDLARTLEEELTFLRAEVGRLQRRNFPTFDMFKDN
ncbi:cilia- and flagella-associated protein 43 [Thalassophryne amazonica]|uniref:cilia- and flagella-associated protein 43 n=1 Tax=Thalassophryne amazonica TaxID=390379 RepID=UPI0014711D25|nr:cilia- and flagella-associated protein 43 [Thalassophryne amazonica]